MMLGSPNRRALVVGAGGQVGHLIASLLGDGDCIRTSRRPDRAGWISLDLASLAREPDRARALLRDLRASAVYCVGGFTNVELCEAQPELAMAVNCDGPAALAAAAREIPFVFFSSEYVFDGLAGPYREDSSARPISVYGQSKWCGEIAVRKNHPAPLIVRTTVVYGYDPGGRNFLYSLKRQLSLQQEVRVPADQVSTPTYNRDLAAAVVALVEAGAHGIYHVCGPERLSRLEFAQRAARAFGLDPALVTGVSTPELGQRAPRPLSAGLTIDKLRADYPRVSMRDLEQAMSDWI
jgi:dTDP-4-dehydrorhamnose reductase